MEKTKENMQSKGMITTNLSFIIPVLNKEDPDNDINVIKNFLRPNDIVVFPVQNYKQVSALKMEISGLKIATGGTSVENILPAITRIPSDVDYVTYDYERNWTPEWTPDQNASIGYFDQLHDKVSLSGKKLIIVPAYVFGQKWDWGEVAKHTDILIVQVQNFQTNAQVPDVIKPSSLGIDLEEVTKKIVKEVREKSPSTKIYLQFGFEVTSDPKNILTDINTVKDLGIDGITLWYNPGTSGTTSKIGLLKELLQNIVRI